MFKPNLKNSNFRMPWHSKKFRFIQYHYVHFLEMKTHFYNDILQYDNTVCGLFHSNEIDNLNGRGILKYVQNKFKIHVVLCKEVFKILVIFDIIL